MIGERWMGSLLRCLVLGAIVSAGGCASVEYRVPTWEVERLAQVPPGMRGEEVRVVPANAVVPPPPAPVAVTPPPEADVGIDVDIDVPVVVATAPRPVVVAPRPVAVRRVAPSTNTGGWRGGAPTARPSATHVRSSGGSRHGGGGGSSAASAAEGAVAAVALIAIVAGAAANAAAADEARFYNGWVAVHPDHPMRLYYGGAQWRTVPLARLMSADLIGLRYAVLEEDDGHVEPLRRTPPPAAAPPPQPPPIASPPPPPGTQAPPSPVVMPTPAPVTPPAPVSQAIDNESP